jgi:hypothetical protein
MTKVRRFAACAAHALSLPIAAVGLADCATDAGGPSFITLGVSMTGISSSAGAGGTNPANLCVRVPVLLGSRIQETTSFPIGLGAKIVAHRDGADVTFSGADNGSSARSYTLAELELGVSELVPVVANGESYDLRIASGCTNP